MSSLPPRHARPARLLPVTALLASIIVGCSTAQAGSARMADSAGSAAGSAVPNIGSAVPTAGSAVPAAPSSGSVPPTTGPPPDPVVGGWTSARTTFAENGLVAPTGDRWVRITDNRVCLEPLDGGAAGICGELDTGDRATRVQFSPDGEHLMLVAGVDEQQRAAYLMDTTTGAIRVVGPGGLAERQGRTGRWGLARFGWSADGSSVLLLPLTTGEDGPLLSVDVGSGEVTEIARLPADLINSRPTIHAARTGIALGAPLYADRQAVFWADPASRTVRTLGRVEQPGGGSVLVTAADPLGGGVLACPWRADGSFGASVRVAVDGGQVTPVLTDSTSCAGVAYSADGRFLAMTAQVDGGYALTILDLQADRRVFTLPLPVAEPTMPPLLSWLGDTVVVADVSGHWAPPALVIRLQR